MKSFKDEVDRLVGEYIVELEEENKKLKEKVSELEDVSKDYDLLSKDFIELGEENKKLKSDLSECECSMHFENDEVGYRKRENKKLKEKVETLELWLDNKEKLDEEYRKQIDKLRTDNIYEEGLYD